MRINNSSSWDEYWQSNDQSSPIQKLYSKIASFYRNKLIGPRLKFELLKAFPNGGDLLHAGSGGGEVDRFVPSIFKVTAIDISINAIHKYKSINENNTAFVGNILNLTHLNKFYDGYYNLGVMEHFSREECRQILENANYVLKDGGKIILFWPPTFGLSVIFLLIVHNILRLVKRNNFKPLHPDEPNKIHRKKFIENLLQETGFELMRFNFSIRDCFTYVSLVGIKINSL